MRRLLALSVVLLASAAQAQRGQADPRDIGGGACNANPYNCKDAPNPLPFPRTVWLEEMTWMDVRDALAKGMTTIIIPTGGLEPNGPWLVTGKHNYVLHANCEAIARKLGDALCAPIVKFVPEGGFNEPLRGHMNSPNTVSVREEVFRGLLADMVTSFKVHGFRKIFLIGDSGGNQEGQRYVADSVTRLWHGDPIVAHIQEYYTYAVVAKHMETRGIPDDTSKAERLHDDPIITLNMWIDDPSSVRWEERVKAGKASINGISIEDRKANEKLAKEIVDFRASYTIDAMKKAIDNKGTLPAPQRGRGRGGM
jgi:creatinine amidohydrolase/Fe(II)-dependent formamide hydrolase-like protein